MSDDYGLTQHGFKAKDLRTIRDELRDKLKNTFGAQLNVSPDSVVGQLIDVFSAPLAEQWELAREIYRGFDRQNATGDALDNIGDFVPVTRNPARETTGTVKFTGDPGVTVPVGTIVESQADDQFETDLDMTLDTTGEGEVTVSALETGPVEADAGTVDTIVTPVDGVDDVINETDFVVGSRRETDAEFRQRIASSLFVGGKTVDQAIKAELLDVDGIDNVQVISNRSLNQDEFGIPGKSFLSILHPETDDPDLLEEVGEILFTNQAAGAKAYGEDQDIIVEDEQGFEQEVSWTWANPIALEIDVNVSLMVGDAPEDADDLLQTVVEDFINDLGPGENVRYTRLFSVLINEVEAIEEMNITITGESTIVVDETFEIDFDELAVIEDTDDITIDLPF